MNNILSRLIDRHAKQDGVNATPITALSLFKTWQQSLKVFRIYNPCLCIIAQGEKTLLLDEEVYNYSPSEYLAISADLPLIGQVTKASKDKPYLGLQIDLDQRMIAELLNYSDTHRKAGNTKRGLFVARTDNVLQEAITRLVSLLETPRDIEPLAPMILREIHYRLLQTDHGIQIAQMATHNTHAQRIASVIQQIKADLQQPVSLEELANAAHMSLSSFHSHFKKVTNMSPLQYQKRLRLTEARRMILSEETNASQAAFQMGYESASQFNREYARLFGAPPKQDKEAMKANSVKIPGGRCNNFVNDNF